MAIDMLERLRIDPGQRTLGELIQERQWALQEIGRLQAEVLRLASNRQAGAARQRTENADARSDVNGAQNVISPQQFLRLGEVCKLAGLSRATLYQMMAAGRFPRNIHVGARAVRWRASDVLAWQQGLGD